MPFDKDRFKSALSSLEALSKHKQKDEKAISAQEQILKDEINEVSDYPGAVYLFDSVLAQKGKWNSNSPFVSFFTYASFKTINCLFEKMLESDEARFLHPVVEHDGGRVIKFYVTEVAKVRPTKMSSQEFQQVKAFLNVVNEESPIYCAVYQQERQNIERHHNILIRLRNQWNMWVAQFPDRIITIRDNFFTDVHSLENSDKKGEESLLRTLDAFGKVDPNHPDPKQNTLLFVLSSLYGNVADSHPIYWPRIFFQHASYALIEALFKKMIQDEFSFWAFIVRCEGKRVIDHFVENFNAVCATNNKLTPEDRAHVKRFLNDIQIELIALYQERRLNTPGFMPIFFTRTLPNKLNPRTATPSPAEATDDHSAQQQKEKGVKPLTPAPSRQEGTPKLTLWKKYWRSIIAVIFGIALVILAFTPAGPALAAALTLKAIFAPIFAWIANIGLAGIGLGFGLLFSGFLLGLPSWITGMVVKATAMVLLIPFIALSIGIEKLTELGKFLWNKSMDLLPNDPTQNSEQNDPQYASTKSTWIVGFFIVILFPLVWILEKIFLVIELTLVSIAELASRTLRKLGAWQARLFNSKPVAPIDKKGALPNMLTPTKIGESNSELSSMSKLHLNSKIKDCRATIYDHAKYYLSDQSKTDHETLARKESNNELDQRPDVRDRSFLSFNQSRFCWLFKDTFSTGQNPYDAAEEAAEKSTASTRPH